MYQYVVIFNISDKIDFMKYSKFLQTGLICLLIAASVGTALGQTTQSLLGDGPVDNYAITMVLKNKMSKDDLAYISANIATKNEKTEAIYKNIGTFVNKHAVKDMVLTIIALTRGKDGFSN